ncbi:MAG: substrate-binding domain-containing protein [Sphaerochaetaceae bacterium]|nr:substrate-binding domain-containing protein [Sphaerochaetaceae bacterium]
MKKILLSLLVLVVAFAAFANGAKESVADKIYVLGPTPDHGWTAQAGAYAEEKCNELTKAGTKALFMPASSGETQVDYVNTIIANGDAKIVVIQVLDDSAEAAVEALVGAKIPVIQFDRFAIALKPKATLNFAGDNIQCGAGIAYWLQSKGMKAGDTIVTLYGDNGSVCIDRESGFRGFLKGSVDYTDNATGKTYHTTSVWSDAAIDKALSEYSVVCNWSADGAANFMEQKLGDILAAAKKNGGNLFIYSMDDEMTFGVLNVLESASAKDQADAAGLNLYISAIGGMQELYDVMNGKSAQAATADKFFDDMMSVYFSPSMMKQAIDYAVDFVKGNWTFKLGDEAKQPVWIVDRKNVSQYQGFMGH